MTRQGKIFRVNNSVSELNNKQLFEANVVINRHGIVLIDRQGIAKRKATTKELQKAKRI